MNKYLSALLGMAMLIATAGCATATTELTDAETSRTIETVATVGIYDSQTTSPMGVVSTLRFEFWKESNGRLAGKITKGGTASAAYANVIGPLRFVEVRGNHLTFESATGASYALEMSPDGTISGTSRGAGEYRAQVAKHTLTPRTRE